MIRVRLFGRCRIYHDPGLARAARTRPDRREAWFRSIELVTPQPLKGEELLRRPRWWTVEPNDVADVVKRHGRLVCRRSGELMVECADRDAVQALSQALLERFGDQVQLAPP
jgi:hypothetical protein